MGKQEKNLQNCHGGQVFLGRDKWESLTGSQQACVRLACELGMSDIEIAERLGVKPRTVAFHMYEARVKLALGAKTSRALSAWYYNFGPGSARSAA